MIIAFAYWIWNWGYRQGTTGSSIGKSVMKFKVISEKTGQPIGFGMSIVRQIAHIVDSARLLHRLSVPAVGRQAADAGRQDHVDGLCAAESVASRTTQGAQATIRAKDQTERQFWVTKERDCPAADALSVIPPGMLSVHHWRADDRSTASPPALPATAAGRLPAAPAGRLSTTPAAGRLSASTASQWLPAAARRRLSAASAGWLPAAPAAGWLPASAGWLPARDRPGLRRRPGSAVERR